MRNVSALSDPVRTGRIPPFAGTPNMYGKMAPGVRRALTSHYTVLPADLIHSQGDHARRARSCHMVMYDGELWRVELGLSACEADSPR